MRIYTVDDIGYLIRPNACANRYYVMTDVGESVFADSLLYDVSIVTLTPQSARSASISKRENAL